MATKIESTEVSQQKKVYVKSEEALDEMEANGQLEPFTDYYTPDEETLSNKIVYDLLWTNPSPASNFSPQTVTIDFSNYDIIVFRIINAVGYDIYRDFFVLKNIQPTFRFQSIANSGTQNRIGNEFVTNGVYLGEGINNNSRDDSVCIPYQIYGVKLGV